MKLAIFDVDGTLLDNMETEELCYTTALREGFGRIDVRLTPQGDVYVIEANPNPSLTEDEDFAQAALSGGMSYDALITEILNAA